MPVFQILLDTNSGGSRIDTIVPSQQHHKAITKVPQSFHSGKVTQEKKQLTSNKASYALNTMATLSSMMKSRHKVTSLDHVATCEIAAAEDDFELPTDTMELPQNESIPQHFWTLASAWIQVVGRDIVACLFSRDWQVFLFLIL